MSCTTTPAEVRVILPDDTTLTDPQIQAAIDAASCVVDAMKLEFCAASITVACFNQICIYLSAHFAAVTDNTLTLSSEEDACCGGKATYGFKFGEGYLGTPFGQMANMLSQGCLATMEHAPAQLFAIGSL